MLKNENSPFNIASEGEFLTEALRQFHVQYQSNEVYRQWVDLLKVKPQQVEAIQDIPFLPIEFFKSRKVVCDDLLPDAICFTSSATTSQIPARHYVNDVRVYEKSFLTAFNAAYGNPQDYCILALLPNYLQRQGSSLVYMCHHLIQQSQHPLSGFFLDNLDELKNAIDTLNTSGQKTLLLGVSYALMDLCDLGVKLNSNFTVMETGGMKGRRKEMLKQELHLFLSNGLGVTSIHSEYGMTELLSQAYSKGEGKFSCPHWMKIFIREVDDPLNLRHDDKTGGINVIDLANVNSCSFIATKDLGRLHADATFEIMGRYDHSDVRGCNLMVGGF
ncbi:MAG: acyl transferase [Bacteroidia bacterium]|nr:acyl transferase [Bacteroidia bacterium]